MKTVTVTSIVRKLYVEHDGNLIEVSQIDNPEDYPKSVTIFSKELVKGKSKGQITYAVPVADFVPKKRVSTDVKVANNIESMLASGMTTDEIVAKLKAPTL